MALKKHDFVEIEYTGKVKDTHEVFDTTDENLAKTEKLYAKHMHYGPLIICLGENQILAALDDEIIGKETDKSYSFEIKEAFGKKEGKLIKLVPTSIFKKQNIQAFPGLRVNIDGTIGTIRTVTGGRTMIDFNHPLANKDVIYEVKLIRKIDNTNEKLKSILLHNMHMTNPHLTITEGVAEVELPITEIPETMAKHFEEKIKQLIPEIKKVMLKPGDPSKGHSHA